MPECRWEVHQICLRMHVVSKLPNVENTLLRLSYVLQQHPIFLSSNVLAKHGGGFEHFLSFFVLLCVSLHPRGTHY